MADIWFDVDTALSEVPINLMPLIDDTDFKSREVALTYNQAGLDLVWNFITTGGTMSQTAVTPTAPGGAYDWQHIGDGMYTIEIPASGGASINNNTEGFGWFTGVATGVLPWRSPIFGFRAAAINNSLIDGATVDVNVTALADDVITAAKFDESTAFPLKSADTGSTQVARVGADSDTLKTLSDEIAAVKAETAAIKLKTDLMDASAITCVTAVVGSTITLLRGDTFIAALTDLGDLTDYVSIDFTVKSDKLQTDDEATIRIRKNATGIGDGLLRLNGAAPTTETGSITIDDEAAGDIRITLDETATDDLSTGSYSYDIQLITATTVKTLTYGKLTVISDVTRAVV